MHRGQNGTDRVIAWARLQAQMHMLFETGFAWQARESKARMGGHKLAYA